MRKSICSAILLLVFSMPFKTFSLECNYNSVDAIQVETGKLLVLLKINNALFWKRIGVHSKDLTKSYQSVLQQALATDSRVMLYYEDDDYNCQSTDYNREPTKIRLYRTKI